MEHIEKRYMKPAESLLGEIPKMQKSMENLSGKLKRMEELLRVLELIRPIFKDKEFDNFITEGIQPVLSSLQKYGSSKNNERTRLLSRRGRRSGALLKRRGSMHQGPSAQRMLRQESMMLYNQNNRPSSPPHSSVTSYDHTELSPLQDELNLPTHDSLSEADPRNPDKHTLTSTLHTTPSFSQLPIYDKSIAVSSSPAPEVSFDEYLLLEKLLPCGCICLVACCMNKEPIVDAWLKLVGEVEDLQNRLMDSIPHNFLEDMKRLALVYNTEMLREYWDVLDALILLLRKADKLARALLKLGSTGEVSPTYMPQLFEMEKKVGKLFQSLSVRSESIRSKRLGIVDFVNEVLDFTSKYSMEMFQDFKSTKGTSIYFFSIVEEVNAYVGEILVPKVEDITEPPVLLSCFTPPVVEEVAHKVAAFYRTFPLDRVVTTSKHMGQFLQKLASDPDNTVALTEEATTNFELRLEEVVQVVDSLLDGIRRSVAA